ncbi:unnamed protein product [Protopolystoma xenopodis]|uniref:dolichyl-P-Man:Man5GlcNAc2-PP-dolichol alpha-1,3-mannosyltransferase n=1 Tax=Protopolystoma xenopodis TaxID=117903 RepID=A0A448WVN0_9PLAT|nr:unnamed protein product [Protopolystoma xenopodis]
MQEVNSFLNGTLDYDKIEGQTGPCVYDEILTKHGTDIRLAQYIFVALYLSTLVLVFNLYRLSRRVPPYAILLMCCISYRIHSIYMLRLFNDPFAMLMLYASINAFVYGRYSLSSVLLSIAVSIKMNILLFVPGFITILLEYRGIIETTGHLAECGIVQLLLGAPFIFHNSGAYFASAFNFGRQFMYKWTVNWRLIPEHLFLDHRFHMLLLALHGSFLLCFLIKYVKAKGGIRRFLKLGSSGDVILDTSSRPK